VSRDLLLHAPRTVLVVLAIAIGIAGAGAVLDTWALLRRVVHEGYRASDPAAATLRTDAVDADLLSRVRAVPGVRDAQARRVVSGRVLVEGSWRPLLIFVAAEPRDIRIGRVQGVGGAWPAPDGALVIERSSLGVLNAGVGDTVLARVAEGEPVRVAVAGVARDVGLAPGWMEHIVYAFATPATIAMLGADGAPDRVQLTVQDAAADRAAVRRIAFAAKAAVEATGRRVTDVEVPEPGQHIHAGQMNSLLYTQAGFGVLALLLSAVLVVNLVTAMLAGQVREIGVMKTLGAGSGQIAAMYLVLAAALGLVATALALPLAAAVGGKYAEFSASMLNFDTAGVPVPRWAYAVQVAVGLVLPLAAAAIPVARGCRIGVGDALRDVGVTDGRAPGAVLGRVTGLARPLLLSVRNAFRRRGRMALTLLTLAMGGAVFIGASNLRASIRAAMDGVFTAMRFQVSFGFARGYPADSLVAAALRVPGVARAEAWGGGAAAVEQADGTFGSAFPVTALPPATPLLALEVLEGRWLRAGDARALVVGSRLREDEPSLQVDSEVTLVVHGVRSRWTVVGVVPSLPGSAYAPLEAWAEARGESRVARLAVAMDVQGPASQADVARRLRESLTREGFEVSSASMVAETRASFEDHLLMVAQFLGAMGWVMIVVGGLALASTMSLAVLERTREIGVLRAIGARHGAIHAIVQGEGLVVGLLSWAVALPLSVPMTVVLADAFGRVFFKAPVRFVPEPVAVLWWLAIVVVVTVLGSLWPAVKATRVSAARALAYE
jgi:putative ABC transport system permease protein